MLYPHTATAWLKDDSERSAKWERMPISRCRFTQTRGGFPSTSGDKSAQDALILIEGECVLKRGDRIVFGNAEDAEPPKEAMTVNTVHPVYISVTTHHCEVSAS